MQPKFSQPKAKKVSTADNRFVGLSKQTANKEQTSKKKPAKPELIDFDLGVKPADDKSKQKDLTDFKLDD